MRIQKSFEKEESGTLYVVPTPIGNLEDITYRALQTLKNAHIIAAEDTRNTRKLLNHFEIKTKLISYHEHNKMSREDQLITRLGKGEQVAIVSDAGMPAISDPGYELVKHAIEQDQKVVVLPGANAALCALVGSGLPTDAFYFYGFLPRKKKDKMNELNRLAKLQATLLFYESPYRLKDTLKAMMEVFGDRRLVIARELTKRFEEYARGSVEELISWSENGELKGEFCLVVEGNDSEEEDSEQTVWWDDLSVMEHVNYYIDSKQLSSKQAIKQTAVDRNVPKREIYQAYHIEEE
ncbi:16S rRNA (cytidine(1402)-2'-O)-methyltransferase [Virgibacillus halodenitrificans]|uniref:16S rRNA (cytidine(1402)-2'-O)-methyltransferase n=1 Tax=Virgibacillus halodenitrificans TaxID=1482 RepID=UPI001EED722E|nr:16S rRNA (cytidine(1402)-2'-O)-methyltransferase [Virgibacillus halodenitrificans]MCG1030263.1 16S rRNA (cytidine(1402)-2'-O)-methyltransferase [Virgibacillus halodenitrificans]MEC2157549.1 16S rRNA (cytidine(1402)-2'-O)-methyltransferase [Virgibacillus halodenitrificans]